MKPQFEYNKSDFELVITLPEDSTFPLSITLGASVKIPSPKMIDLLVGSGAEDEPEDSPEKDKKKFGLHLKVILLLYFVHFCWLTFNSYQLSPSHLSRSTNPGS